MESTNCTVDSGYASSGSPSGSGSGWLAPNPDWVLSRTYENWKIADAATQRYFVDKRQLETCTEQLRAARKRRDRYRDQAQRRCVCVCVFVCLCVRVPPDDPHGGW